MALKGNIETFYLSSIFQLLAGDKKTGILTIANKDRIVRVYIKNGNIVYAVGSRKEVRLGYLLRAKGIISADELQKALALAKQRNERLGRIMVEKSYISVETLKKFIHQRVRDILYDLFLWKGGDFEYVDQEIDLDEEFLTELNHMEVILEGTRRVDEWEILRKNIPNTEMVFKINKNVEEKKDTVNLTANEWRIISLVDGKRTVQEIVTDSGHDEFVVYRMINSLISSGLIEKSTAAGAAAIGGNNQAQAIIRIYHQVLMTMLKVMQNAIGQRALSVMEEAKAQVPAQHSQWLHTYNCQKDAKSNVKLVLDAAADSPPSNEELLNAFNGWILATLHQQKRVVGEQVMSATLQELTRPNAGWREYPGKSDLKGAIFAAIVQTVEQFQQEMDKAGEGKEKGGGILSFLKRK